MLQVYVSNISTVFRSMLQVFYLDVTYVALAINICCTRMFPNVLSVSDVCCRKCFKLQVFLLAGTGRGHR
jgi:hypothetical protein